MQQKVQDPTVKEYVMDAEIFAEAIAWTKGMVAEACKGQKGDAKVGTYLRVVAHASHVMHRPDTQNGHDVRQAIRAEIRRRVPMPQ